MTGAAALRASDIAKRYGATIALDGVDFDVRAGEVHALIGENGAGKSTLLDILNGSIRADRGVMQCEGESYAPGTPHDARRRGIALIHQELSLCAHLSVMENLLLGTEVTRRGLIDERTSRARAAQLLAELPHPELRPDTLVRDLSLPARQIVEICRALASDARVLLMDEPTSSLQGDDVERLFALIRRLTARGVAVVYVSHFLEEVRRIATRFTVLRDGRSVSTGAIANTSDDALIASMVGRPASAMFTPSVRYANPGIALSVSRLASPPKLRDATFDLRHGEILGIAGLVGSGRTELVRALFGLDTPTSGSITFGEHIGALIDSPPSRRLEEGMGYLSEDRKGEGLALPMSLTDNVCATSHAYAGTGFGVLDAGVEDEMTHGYMNALAIRAHSPRQAVRTLSGGNQQKVQLARLLQQDAKILLLDEPTRGIDIGSKADVYDVIARRASAGCAVLVVSSYLPELFGLCDRVAVMCRGVLSPARPIDEWTPESVMAMAVGNTGSVMDPA